MEKDHNIPKWRALEVKLSFFSMVLHVFFSHDPCYEPVRALSCENFRFSGRFAVDQVRILQVMWTDFFSHMNILRIWQITAYFAVNRINHKWRVFWRLFFSGIGEEAQFIKLLDDFFVVYLMNNMLGVAFWKAFSFLGAYARYRQRAFFFHIHSMDGERCTRQQERKFAMYQMCLLPDAR